MSAATLQRRQRLQERGLVAPSRLRVDREAGVVHEVKVLGLKSINNRRYTPEAVKRAVSEGLYEGVKVFIDHPGQPREQRSAEKLFGKLRKAHLGEDGVYADLHCNTAHPMWPRVAEDCEKGLGLYGLSHNAEAGDYRFEEGLQVITEISAVDSVDLVSEPATNANLWEGRTVAAVKLREWLSDRSADRALSLAHRKLLLEMGGYLADDDMTMDEPAPEADGRQLLAQAVAALMSSGDASDHDLATKVLKLLKPEGAAEPEPEEATVGMESKKKTLAAPVLNLEEARDLCSLADVQPTQALLDALVGLPEANARKMVLATKATTREARRGGGPPRSASGLGTTESKGVPADLNAALNWLKE